MAYVQIPIAADQPSQRLSVQLDGAGYELRLRYNSRAGMWSLDIAAEDGTDLVTGIAMRLGIDLLAGHADARLPAGMLMLINTANAYGEPTRDNLGRDVALIYQEAA